jgi:DNA-methyltransferase (dcm)
MRVVELFAGVGGFRLGLKNASSDFEFVWCNQWEPGKKKQYAFDCYQNHFGVSTEHVNEDIGLVKDKVKDHDLLVGGFPCQDYSVARTQAQGMEGKKGVLWWHINDIIEQKTPKYVLLENVDRLIKSPSSQRGRDFGVILRCLADKGYIVEWRVINAAEYGQAQRRRRIFIFAYHKNTDFYKNNEQLSGEEIVSTFGFFSRGFPIKNKTIEKSITFDISPEKYDSLVELSDEFENKFYSCGVMSNHNVYSRECVPKEILEKPLSSIVEDIVDEKYFIDNEEDLKKWAYLKGAKRGARVKKSNGATYFYSEGAIAFPDPMDRPGRTMLTSEGKLNRCSHIICDNNDRYRVLTPKECERLNGFEDDWTKDMPESARYFTMGNALVVPLVTVMGDILLSIDKPPREKTDKNISLEGIPVVS